MLRTRELEYELPEGAVAVEPASPRDSARLMVLRRREPGVVEHRRVRDLPEYLGRADVMVVNTSKVIPARFEGVRTDTGGGAEGLYLGPPEDERPADPAHWRVMLRARRLREGVVVALRDRAGADAGVALRLLRRAPGQGEKGAWVVRAEGPMAGAPAVAVLERIGTPPLPPYIRAARRRHARPPDHAADRERYQTVYAHDEADDDAPGPADAPSRPEGSVAAPTAGLHFTPALLAALEDRGVRRAEVMLHVGTGTFKPVESEHIEEHPMHAEWCRVPAATARAVAGARGVARVLAVGTTSARTLESFTPDEMAAGVELAKWTNLLITPGRPLSHVDALLTNFHLPRSTLMALVATLLDERSGGAGDGAARLREAYAAALAAGYRFYSYGDAMLLL